MKKIVNLILMASIIGFFLISCDRNEDENVIQNVDAIKIDSVKIAQTEMDIFTVQTIKTYSTYSDGCHGFYTYDYERDNFDRYVTAYQYKVNGNCTQATYVGTNGFNFRPEEKGTYTFKFWNGKDTNNKNVWIEKTIIVK